MLLDFLLASFSFELTFFEILSTFASTQRPSMNTMQGLTACYPCKAQLLCE